MTLTKLEVDAKAKLQHIIYWKQKKRRQWILKQHGGKSWQKSRPNTSRYEWARCPRPANGKLIIAQDPELVAM
jgi:hypothetical protein